MVIDRIGQGLVVQETIHKEDAPVFVQRASDPNGQADLTPTSQFCG